jgi:hypothetical protein
MDDLLQTVVNAEQSRRHWPGSQLLGNLRSNTVIVVLLSAKPVRYVRLTEPIGRQKPTED